MLSLVLAATTLFAAPLPAQDPVEFGRLATEQRQVAEQVRRLNQLLEMLEQRDREEGREERADLLAQARTQLEGASENGNLVAAVEGVARELAALHTGNALEGQAELIQVLQDLLDYLIETERKEQEMALEKELADRIEALREFEQRQADILQKTQRLEQAQKRLDGESSPQDAESDPDQDSQDPQDSDGEPQDGEQDPQDGERQSEQDGQRNPMEAEEPLPANQEEIDALREELAELQEQLAQELKEFNQEQEEQTGRRSEQTQQAEEATEKAAEELRSESAETQPQDPAESLKEAIEQEKRALEKLQEAKKQAEQQQDRSEEAKRREALLNVMREAQIILDRHINLEQELQVLAANMDGDRVPRSARSQMRQIARSEEELGIAAEQLLLTIADAGADSFPLYIQGLMLDHEALAKEVGPPRYRLQGKALPLAAGLTADWQQLIEVIRIEQERIRRRMEEQDGGEGGEGGGQPEEDQERPLVDFAMELQLLKRMQASLADRLVLARDRIQTFADAGIEMGPEDTLELEALLERQGELQLQFESMVRRLQGTDETDGSEDL